MISQNSYGWKRSIWIILVLLLLGLPFFMITDTTDKLNSKDKFKTSYVTLDNHNPDYWKADGPFGNYIRENELIGFRDKNAKHFPSENGNVAVISGGAIHYLDENGEWQEIDTRVRTSQVPGYAFENTRNGIRTWYPDEAGESIEVGLDNEFLSIGSNMTLSWEGESGKVLKRQSSTFSFPEPDSNKVVYHAFFPGVDNEFEIEPDKVKNKLILKRRPTAKGTYLVLTEQLVLPKGWTVKLNEESIGEVYETKNGFEIVDAIGITQLYVPAPEIYSIGEQKNPNEDLPAKWILEQEGQVLTLKMQVAQTWLQDPNLKYPLVLDPTLNRTGNKAGFVASGGSASPDGFNEARVGLFAGENNRGYIQWNIGSIPVDSRIDQVSGLLYARDVRTNSFNINVNQIAGDYGNYWGGARMSGYADMGAGPTYYSFGYVGGPLTYPTWGTPIDYGAQARADVKAQLLENDNRFQVGLSPTNAFCRSNRCSYAEFTHTGSRLVINYCVPFGITTQPTDKTICKNGNATFSVTIQGSGTKYNKQWQYSSDNGITWNDLNDGGSAPAVFAANTLNLSLSNIPVSWANYLFRFGASNVCSEGVVWSDGAKLNITPTPSPVLNPKGKTICEGGNITLEGAFNDATSHIWQQSIDDGTTWTDLMNNANFSGVTTALLTIANAPASFDGRRFRLRGYNDCEENFTNSATLSLLLTPTVLVNPTPTTILNEQTATFTAELSGSTINRWVYTTDGGVTWKVLINGSIVSGATSNTLILNNVPLSWNGREIALRGRKPTCDPIYTNKALLTVLECFPPQAICQDITVQLDANNNATIAALDVFKENTSGCELISMAVSPNTFNCNNLGDQTVQLTIRDKLNATSTCEANVTVIDGNAPQAICKNVTAQLDENGQATVVAPDFDNGSFDACGEITLSFADEAEQINLDCSHANLVSFVTLIVSDESGNTSTCSQTLIVSDDIPPVAKCKDATVELNDQGIASGTVIDFINDGSYDNCSIAFSGFEFTFDCSNIGTSFPNTLTINDLSGNSSSCTANITVVDRIKPIAKCQDLTVQLDENGMATISPEQVNNGSSDACGIAEMSLDETTIFCSNATLTLKVIDNNGNESTCTSNVSVVDGTPPVAKCKSILIIQVDASGKGTYSPQDLDNGSTDNCGTVSFEFTDGSAEKSIQCGSGSIGEILKVKDNNGNESICATGIFSEDNIPPVAKCKNITLELPANGLLMTSVDINDGSYDNCQLISPPILEEPFSCGNVGTFSRTLTLKDVSGNESSCTGQVTIVDRIAPEALCQDVTVQSDDNGQGTITPEQVDNGSSDACGIKSLELNKTTVTCTDQSVVLTVTDNNDNQNTCTANLIFDDQTPPTALCKDQTVSLDANGDAVVAAQDLDNGSSDNCGSVQLEFTDGSTEKTLQCTSKGIPGVRLTLVIKDGTGNQNTCTSNIIIEDHIPPVAKCKDITIELDAEGSASFTILDINDGSYDNCGLNPFFSSPKFSLDCSDLGTHERQLTVKDFSGNQHSCTGKFTVVDRISPIPDLNSLPDINVECAVDLSSAPTATDNCAGTIIGTITNPPSYSSQGTHIITWTFDDGNGNAVTQTQTVIIKDVTAPLPDVATLPTITASCEAGLEPPFATDNCAGQIIGTTSDPLYFDKEGTYTVTWIFDDGNGNSSSQDQTIVIKNEVAPVPDRLTLPTLRAQCGLTVSQVPTASDHCGGTIIATTSDPLTYNTQGTYLITWTFDNGNGNTSTQTQKVVIRDTKAPVPDRSNLPALTGSCSVMITNFPTATDNCAGSVTATTDSPLEFDQEGTYAIIWNYEDGNGNTSSQIQWVIISSDAEPTAECKNISVALGTNNQVNIKAEDIDKGSYDECGSVTLLISSAGSSVFSNSVPPAPSMDLYCKDGKVHNLMLSVTNEKGNTAYCQATVFLEGTDSDNDGILDQCDNCPDTYNPDQKDDNSNGTGDACEESTDPGTDPGSWEGWSLKKQGSDQAKLITELRAFPNPFQEEVNLSFSLNQEERTTVEIFNIQGQRVHTLLSEIAPRGEHRILWDGKDQNGQPMPAGIYLIRLRAGKALINQKVILQR